MSENAALSPTVKLQDREGDGRKISKLKLIIDAEANQAGVEFDVDIGADDRCERRILQVDEEILDSCRPVIGEGALDAGAAGPAGLVGALPIAGGVDDDVTESDAAGQVE